MKYWAILFLCIALEVCGTTSMKFADGFSKLLPSLLVFVFYALAFSGMILVLKGIDLSIAYAVWAGVGTALTAAVGFIYFKDKVTVVKLVCIALIIIGCVGLKLSGKPEVSPGKAPQALRG